MMNFPLRPLLRQPLSLRSLSPNAVSVARVQEPLLLSSDHAKVQIARKKDLHGSHQSDQIRRRLFVPCRVASSSSVGRKALKVFTAAAAAQTVDDAHVPGAHLSSSPWRGTQRRRIGGGGAKETKSFQLRMQLIRHTPPLDDNSLRRSATTRKASRREAVDCVKEDVAVEVTNHPAPTDDDEEGVEGSSHRSSEVILADGDVCILTQYMTRYNFVRVLEVSRSANSVLAGSRVLLLDKPGNVHSIYQKHRVLTGSYYDILAAIPAIIPEGPVGILGLGAGTAARLIHHFWPEIDMLAWELDPGVIQAARNHFDLEELEWKGRKDDNNEEASGRRPLMMIGRRRNSSGSYGAWKDESDEVKLSLFQGVVAASSPQERYGKLRVHIGDALDPDVRVDGGFAGLIVDLFAEGAVIPALQQVGTWRRMREKLMPGGRIMVNCGGSCVEAAGVDDGEKKDGGITMRETLAALAEAFPGELSITRLREHGDNSLALTGPPPDFQLWKDTLPECLRRGIEDWRSFSS